MRETTNRQLYFKTVLFIAQNVLPVSAFPYSHHQVQARKCFYASACMEKPKRVASFGQ
jgi:hypothetical protein